VMLAAEWRGQAAARCNRVLAPGSCRRRALRSSVGDDDAWRAHC
jgi:hypothetical protein